jgi:transcriptional regulator with XRE-family HTH domain
MAAENEYALELRRRIKKRGWTLAEFQRRSGLTRNVVYRLARDKAPSREQLERIECAFSTSEGKADRA